MSTRDHEFISQLGATFFLTSSIMGWKHVFIKPILLHFIFQNNANVKSNSARELLNYFAECAKLVPGQTHKFWQRNSDLKFIPNDEMLRQKLDYIHYNPLQLHCELVTDAVDYPFRSCKYYETSEDSQGLEVLNL